MSDGYNPSSFFTCSQGIRPFSLRAFRARRTSILVFALLDDPFQEVVFFHGNHGGYRLPATVQDEALALVRGAVNQVRELLARVAG